jgi:IclR family KDG regulon transcriptional repressor
LDKRAHLAERTAIAAEPPQNGRAPRSEVYTKSLAKGLKILALFSLDRPEWTLKRIVLETGIPRPTAYRLLRTLEEECFVVFDASTSSYHLGPAMIPAVYLVQDRAHLLKVLHQDLIDLSERCGELVSVAMDANGLVVTMDVVYHSDLAAMFVPSGRIQTGLANSHAKVLAAYKSREELAELLARPQTPRTVHTVTDPDKIAKELAEVARDGVAFDCEEHYMGICGVGAPIRDRTGCVIASVSIVVPMTRYDPERRLVLAQHVKEAGAAMSARLGLVTSESVSADALSQQAIS